MRIKSCRNKGNSFERRVAQTLRELGFLDCTTSRFSSKQTDDEKIDLCGTSPMQIQIKAVEKLGPPHNILSEMPQREGKYNILWHKINNKGVVVSMYEKDFLILLKLMISHGIIKPEC